MSAGMRLAVLGDPLRFTRSPELHRAGCAALGVACESQALRTPLAELRPTLERLAAEGFTGCNLTMPLKGPALDCVVDASPAARRARSVNTITFRSSGLHADTTDGEGFVDLLRTLDRDPAQAEIVLLGSGGSARSLALALGEAGRSGVRVVSRRDPGPEAAWGGALGERWSEWGSSAASTAIASADVVVNCTPLGGGESPTALEPLRRGTLVVDLGYGEAVTPWVAQARALGLEAVDGLGLLVHQARRSLTIWLGREVPLAPLAAAVGWPR